MVLTQSENDFLTRVGQGTPAGEWLRRFWHPIAPTCELTGDNPTKFVRLLGEDLVLFKDKSGNVGLIQDHCAHRGASLLYGRVEERGISCAYHGWLYDTRGNCLETPAEPADSKFYLTVKAAAYPVQKFIGMYWAYLGPQPAPVIPRYTDWVRTDRKPRVTVYPMLDCNWFSAAENAMDPAHLQILHQDVSSRKEVPINTTRGTTDDVDYFECYETPYGIMKKRVYKNGMVDEHDFLWPTYLGSSWLRTPVDDDHTLVFILGGGSRVRENATLIETDDAIVEYLPPLKEPADAIYPEAEFFFYAPFGQIASQDHVMWETQGPGSFRTQERLATSDRGIVMLRELLRENIEKVMEGMDPAGIIRDPDHSPIDHTMGRVRLIGQPDEATKTPMAPRELVVPRGRK
jgi:5,5'-dehydrodivanillate O-demethylase oxygenase subunit